MNHVTLRAARPRAWLLSLLLASALALALCPPAGTRAAEVVDSCTEGALLSALQGGGEISFSCGGPATISLTRPLPISTDTVLDGGDQITLSGGGVTSVIEVAPGISFTLRNITIRDGRDLSPDPTIQVGGMGVGSGASVTVLNSRFIDNDGSLGGTERGGGAIAVHSGGTLLVRDSEFSGNRGVNGGAINMLLSSVTVENSVFTNNEAVLSPTAPPGYLTGYGGAIYVDGASPHGGDGGHLIIRGSVFTGNRAPAQGGAVYSFPYEGDSTTIEGSTFVENVAGSPGRGGRGGAIHHDNGPLTIRDTTIADNTAYGDGGGLLSGVATPGVLENVTIVGNRALAVGGENVIGGAMKIVEGSYTITNATIAGNFAAGNGGGIQGGSAPVTIRNSIIANNVAGDGSTYGDQCAGGFAGDHNIQFPHVETDVSCTGGITYADPRLEALASNGGPTPTMALLAGSPAIDAGADCPATDQRGAERQGACDIGAFEFGAPRPPTTGLATPVLQPIANEGSPLITVTWSRVSRAAHYELLVESGPAGAVVQSLRASTSAASIALHKGDYSVRVRACLSYICGDYSQPQPLSVAFDPLQHFLPLAAQ